MRKTLLALLLCCLVSQARALNAYDLRCELLHQPWGIDTATPALSWKINLDHNGVRQQAYQILAASRPDLLTEEKADLWNTGKVESRQQLWVPYAGNSLRSGSVVYWQVKVWDEKDRESGWAGGAHFSVGLLDRSDWKGSYIGMQRRDRKVQPLLRQTFNCRNAADAAFLHISTLGYQEVYLNGRRVGDDALAPSVVQFEKRSLSQTYEVTSLLRKGRNDLVIWLGGGWYDNPDLPGVQKGGPYVLAQINQLHGTESEVLVKTDSTWKARPSGYYDDGKAMSGQFGGEVVKAQEMLPDFESSTLDSATWQSVALIPETPAQPITPMMCEANKVQLEVQPRQITRFDDKRWMVDMGKSIVGWTRIRLGHLRKGQRITISYCDMLGLDGDFEFGVYTDYYIASGVGDEVFCNKFNYHAYRYIKLEGLERQPQLSDITGLGIYTGYRNESSFVCNDADINAIHDMVHYTFKCLTQSGYMVDCPHHERQGYGGDGNASILAAQTQYDLYPLYRNWLQAYGDAQGEDGEVPHVAPNGWDCGGGPFWCAFIANAPWQTYQQYGDIRVLQRYYPCMQRYLRYAERFMPDGLLSLENRWPSSRRKNWFLGDWALPNEEHQHHTESIDDVNSCSMSWVYGIMSKVAAALGKTQDAALYADRQQAINRRIHAAFFNKKDNSYAQGLQLDLAFPLFVDATPENLRQKVSASLRELTHERFEDHLFTGLVGIPILTQWLTRSGDAQLMYEMLKQRSFPGYLYMIENNATTTWEHWNARRSRIHNCYNGIGSWFYQALAGILPDERHPAYERFSIRPQMADGISFVRALKPTPYGNITVDWNLSEQTFDLRVTIPEGTTASVETPVGLKVVSAEMPATNLVRYGLIYNENQRDRKPEAPSTKCDISQPIELQSGTYRIIYRLK